MKRLIVFIIFGYLTLVFVHIAAAQSEAGFRGQSMNGSTGLFFIPSGRIGQDDSNFGLDFGYRAVINDARAAHIPAVSASLFKLFELSAAFDIQPDLNNESYNDDILLGLKFKFPVSMPVSIGASFQFHNIGGANDNYKTIQPYIAVTYPGTLFSMKAETTLIIGKTIYLDGNNDSNIDFGMGFDLILFPDAFGNAVHWIIDYANFGYSDNTWPNNSAWFRGVLNTGFRIDLSAIPVFSNFKILLDFIFNDLFDDQSRSFTAGAVFGFKF